MKRRNFTLGILALLPVMPLLAGCWSQREIDDLSLVAGIALDKAQETKVETALNKNGAARKKDDLISITYQVFTSSSGGGQGRGGGGSSEQKRYQNFTETGDLLLESTREISLRTERPIFAQHFKTLVIGDELLRTTPFRNFMDLMYRESEFRPSALVFVARGLARETFELKGAKEIPAFRILKMVDNQYKSTRILPSVTLTKLLTYLQSKSSFLLQAIVKGGEEIKFAGAGIVQGQSGKLVGFLDEDELSSVTLITGKVRGGTVKFTDEETGQKNLYEILSYKSDIVPRVEGDNLSFEVRIESRGRLSESWVMGEKSFNDRFLKRQGEYVAKQMERSIRQTLEKIQKQYKADVLGFGKELRIHEPKIWDKVKSQWDQRFSQAEVRVQAKTIVAEFGASGSKIVEHQNPPEP
ncbi:Ger(x)C family spore germination protein [Paenibacillus ehimensis]|uniref:Ger(X)C family spore germination protein n=1 Tax=Paenibacillus ehimensis TaxID=79264 RepID=A0ABT8V4W4_9BACL|nr:Ger(x)C family spore germination protein [Paenibacillus ehimensis]MDO3676480.1 Ger(x)C family spore germination protein [Paenibacillus ehimensis]MEC0208394.1 Ger(x)C family spore germination protein [Paenibacillus ehimensis]